MEEKYRDVMSELLYDISNDIYDLLNADYDDIENTIFNFFRVVNKLSEDVYEDELVYKNKKFNLT